MTGAKILERTSSIAVILAAIIVAYAVLVRGGRRENRPTAQQIERELRGTRVTDRRLVSENSVTLILALSTTCPFCEQNSDFYRELSGHRTEDNFRLVGVFPQSGAEATAYLKTKGITADDVFSMSLNNVGVQVTPTVLLVGHQGLAIEAWVGALDRARQDAILQKLSQLKNYSQKENQQ